MARDIWLRSVNPQSCISYLQQEHIEKYGDVKLTSIADGYSVFVNKIMLASLSRHFRYERVLYDDEDEILILCEHSKEVLLAVESLVSGKHFLTAKNQLPTNIQNEIQESFGLDINLIESKNFGLDLEEPRNPPPPVQTAPITEVYIKKEPTFETSVTIEDLQVKEDFDYYLEETEDVDIGEESDDEIEYKPATKKTRRSRKSQKSQNLQVPKKSNKEEKDQIPTQVEGFVRFPPEMPSMQQKARADKLRDFQEKMKDQIKVGSLPHVDRAGLLAFELPKPIESYLKSSQSKYTPPPGKRDHKFVCSICLSRCRTEATLQKHINKYHVSKYVCPMENCSEYFDTKFWYNFVRHMYEHTLVDDSNLSLYECICCGYGTNVQDRMTRHLDANGRYHNNECTQCDQKFLSHVDYQIHVNKEHHGKWIYRCGLCCDVFEDKEKRGKFSYFSFIQKN